MQQALRSSTLALALAAMLWSAHARAATTLTIATVNNPDMLVMEKLSSFPFYGESTFTAYRKDLFAKAGLTMPERPTWTQVADFAKKINDPAHGVYGMWLRGKSGWGENMGALGDMANSFGGRYFDMKWQPQFTSDAWRKALDFYVRLLRDAGPPGVTADGYNEMPALFANGHCGMWVDATVSAGFLANPKESKVAGEVGYAQAPYQTTAIGSHYLWAWTLAIPKTSHQTEVARQFVEWATSPAYLDLVARTQGWGSLPPGTRTSTYENAEYLKAAPFAPAVLEAIRTADPNHPTQLPVPYTGISYVSIPRWQAIGTTAGQYIAGAVSGQSSEKAALDQAQEAASVALFLASDASSLMTGSIVVADAGYCVWCRPENGMTG